MLKKSFLAFLVLLFLDGSAVSLRAQTGAPGSGVDVKAIDKSVDPCQDFYRYACGNWMQANPIPPEYAVWGRFNELQDRNLQALHSIADDALKNTTRSAVDSKVSAFYGSCMDETAVNKLGASVLKPEFDRIDAMKTKADLPKIVADLQTESVNVLFRFGAGPDPEHAETNMANLDQGGLGLPERGFYTRTDPKSEATRRLYVEHIGRMFQLTGMPATDATARAASIMALETALAKASLDNVSRRDPKRLLHKMPLADAEQLMPDFQLASYLAERGTPAFAQINVRVPDFFRSLETVLQSTSLDDLKTYLKWHYLSTNAAELSTPFETENFNFFQKHLTGAKQMQPRWKRCVSMTDKQLGEALGQKYVEKEFSAQGKEKTLELVGMIEKSMASDIDSLTWMSAATKNQALTKLKGVTNKIGYPDKWRDYSSVKLNAGDLLGNVTNTREFEERRDMAKIGKPVDRKEWGMTPPTVNAYYSPLQNNINFPAGILQTPFYNNTADMAVNFGGIGAVIGHELTHGFDDQGRQYDADGNLRDWWTAQDAEEFRQRADCIVKEYSGFSPTPGVQLNGKLTLGENAADNGGIRLAYMALMMALTDKTVADGKLDGYTPQQRFFLGFGQIWCSNAREEALRLRSQTDPHSPGEFRVNGVVRNDPDFGAAFACSAGQPMNLGDKACRVW